MDRHPNERIDKLYKHSVQCGCGQLARFLAEVRQFSHTVYQFKCQKCGQFDVWFN